MAHMALPFPWNDDLIGSMLHASSALLLSLVQSGSAPFHKPLVFPLGMRILVRVGRADDGEKRVRQN